ncbi:MAG: FecR domain-containing protein [Myxococcota bacterium]|nr:FecR domain-containing protein [Myxococcota bacterium]
MIRGLLPLASLFALLASPAFAQATRYTVREGDTCRGIAARVYGDGELYARIHAANPQLGPPPHSLEPGAVLTLPAPEPPASLSAVHRRVERRAPDAAAFADARAGQRLPRGTQVRTHEAASAEITFPDDAQVTVRERTLVIVYGGERRLSQRRITRAELERGALRSRLGELAGRAPLEVETPSSRASLDGDGVVSVEEDGTSRVANHGRRVATVEAGGERVRLPPGTGTVVRRGERPTRARRLLPPPRWTVERRGPVIGFVGLGGNLRAGFEPVRGADRYRVEVAASPRGAELLTTLEVAGDARSFAAEGLPEGTVYVSVASIDPRGLEGRRSPWRAFTVRLARLVEPGGGTPDAGARPPRVWPGTWLVAPRTMDCQGDDGAWSGIVTLRETGSRSVTCRDRAGDEPAPLAVVVRDVRVEAESDAALVRDRTTALRLRLPEGGPPIRTLVAALPEGFDAGPPRETEGGVILEVRAPPNAPGEARVGLAVAAGSERVPLGALVLAVRDPRAAPNLEPEPALPEPETRPRPAQSAFGDVAWPSGLSLRDERRGGLTAWLSATAIEAAGDPQVRIGAGARAQLPELPLRLGFASQLDVLARPSSPERRGDADLFASVGALLFGRGALGLAVDVGAWIPTRQEPESLGRVRLAPSIEASWRPAPWLALRTRQGALVDLRDPGARLWAGALGVDFAPIDALAFGAAIEGSAGAFADGGSADRDGAALALGGGAELRLGLVDVALAARAALTDEGAAVFGAWSVSGSLRLHGE